MKFALVNGIKQEAQKGLLGNCPHCDRPVNAKCGEKYVNHWSHMGKRDCDSWAENETEWHKNWKRQFPDEWQEITHWADDGEIHRADVKTKEGWVIEFQHSKLKPEERLKRNTFYPKLIWVVNGLREKKDVLQFFKSLNSAKQLNLNPPAYFVKKSSCAIINEWAGNTHPVFFDFGKSLLWCFLPNQTDNRINIVSLDRSDFIKMLHGENINTVDFNDYLIPNYTSPETTKFIAVSIQYKIKRDAEWEAQKIEADRVLLEQFEAQKKAPQRN